MTVVVDALFNEFSYHFDEETHVPMKKKMKKGLNPTSPIAPIQSADIQTQPNPTEGNSIMSTATTAQKNVVNIIGCGGCGYNVASLLEPARAKDVVGFAKYNLCYIDTSKSNMIRKKINMDDVYLFEDMDGSGKIRKENHKVISANTKAVLQKFKPTAFNIVVHSAAGGKQAI